MNSPLTLDQLPLPALREDIALQAAPAALDGSPHWHLYDPVRNRFFRIGWLEFELISRWRTGMLLPELCKMVCQHTTLVVEHEDVMALLQFLQGNELLRTSTPHQRQFLQKTASSRKQSIWTWLLHNYLFIRIPLVHPEALLARLLPYVSFIFLPSFFVVIGLLTLLGLVRLADSWTEFSNAFLYFFSWQGALFYATALVLTKLVHELGHAFVAKHYGLRIPTMGIAFMLLMPLLYTDTSEGWKLKSRRARLLIDGAGIIAELCLAGIALLAWTLLPDGPLKSAAYILAAVTWVSTLLVNLNPFMRFDGYYLLMDAVDIPNLQSRSFAVGRWQMRRVLLGIQDEYPEPEYRSHEWFMLAYAYATWLYRLILFTAIAAVVYYFFFKLLGIILFMVEIGWFIALPIYKEASVWWSKRATWGRNAAWSELLLTLILGWLLLPTHSEIKGEGYWQASTHTRLYASAPARVVSIEVNEGQAVKAGDILFKLESPENDWQLKAAQSRAAGVQGQIIATLSNENLRERTEVLKQELTAAQTAGQAQITEKNRLNITAPHTGVVRDMSDGLYVGSWISPQALLGNLINQQSALAHVFISEADIHRIKLGATAKLYSRRADIELIHATVSAIDPVATHNLPEAFLASTHGGPIAVRNEGQRELIPKEAIYRVTLNCEQQLPAQITPVTAFIEGEKSSVLLDSSKHLMTVLIRELGF